MGQMDNEQTISIQCGDCKTEVCKIICISFCFPEPPFPHLQNGKDNKIVFRKVRLTVTWDERHL